MLNCVTILKLPPSGLPRSRQLCTRGRICRCINFIPWCSCHRWLLRHIRRHPRFLSWNLASYFLFQSIWMVHKIQPESHPTKVEILSLLAFLCCVRVGVPGRRRRVMHSVALTATAPLELPELKQQRCWLPVNDHRSSSATLSLFHFMDPDPALALFDAHPPYLILTTTEPCKIDEHPFAKGSQCWSQDKSASSSSWDSSGPWNQPDHLGSG